MDEKNMYTTKSGKSSEFKNSEKKKGLSLRNTENHVVCNTTMVKQYSSNRGRFQIYSEDSNESNRSRSRVRKNVPKKKEIRARRDNEVLKKTTESTIKLEKLNSDLYISRRARSSSNCRQNALSDKINVNSKLFNNRRSYSESRGIPLQCAQSSVVQLPNIQKIKHLTDDVKRRTSSSIQTWKEKMRKPYTGTMPKNRMANTNLNNKTLSLVGINKVNSTTNLQKNSVTGSMNLQPELLQNANEGNRQAQNIDSLKNALQQISNELEIYLQNNKLSSTIQNDTNKRNFISENADNNNLLGATLLFSSNSVTPLDGSISLPLTPTKVHYEKCVMTRKLTIKKENEYDVICETPYERDYLEDIPETEYKRNINAPRLSPHFLRENVNAEQRRIVVGYIIRLGIHCYYSSHVIYQTVKLFNVAIDRIHVGIDDIQLIALACLWIILKQDAPSDKIPSATVILELAKDLYSNQEKDLLKYEKKILCAVKFNTRFADPFSLLSYYILNVNQDSRCNIIKPNDIACVYFCGSYMIDSSMLDENLCETPVYIIAIAAVELSLRIVYLSDVNVNPEWYQVWRNKQSLIEWEERMLNSTKQIMIQRTVEYKDFGANVIYKKYMRSKHGKITNFLHNKLKNIL
ncbi:PREDICTED: uncharacterized protein LOC108690058 isoform X1 [Atta colombica]|uniref:uncharacterized protein LOC108690058 isoform X1 n=1 Tax=Atta colombica TaxID=520822 RepID=UPI00084CD3E2|nr:PREDICTED: uncharacterized protein LOC108690058 isoform X1 [Atta colombica]